MLKCLRSLISRRKDPAVEIFFHKTKIYENFFETCLLLTVRKPASQNKRISLVCKESDDLLLDELIYILNQFNKPSKNPRISASSLEYFIPLIDENAHDLTMELCQKIILNSIDLKRMKKDPDQRILDLL